MAAKGAKKAAGKISASEEGGSLRSKDRNWSARELVILTGMSGAGKASALKAFEDLGYYSVDNLPLELIPRFADLVRQSAEIRSRGAGDRCARRHPAGPVSGDPEEGAQGAARRACCFWRRAKTRWCGGFRRRAGRIRWDATRRCIQSISAERKRLDPVRNVADIILDTTKFNVHELRAHINAQFERGSDKKDRRP